LWDIRQRKLISEFYGHRATVSCGHFVDQAASMIISCSNDGRAILWNVQQNCKKTKISLSKSLFSCVAIFAEIDVDNATPLTSIIAMNTQK
jgi:WD40 repeat protein